MISPRGWWLLFILGILLVASVWTRTAALTLLCLTVLFWFLWSLFLFVVRVRLMHGQLYIERQVLDDQGPVPSLWADRTYCVRVLLFNRGALPTPYLRVADRVPYGAKLFAGEIHADGHASEEQPLEVMYYLHSVAPGRLRFEGLHVQCADVQGMFYYNAFVRAPQFYRVLPPFADIEGHFPAVKRHNVLPTAGHHRYRRPGSGSELLDLRDYIPGDPPKTIAWKVSARRDRLITKVFESEVPIRCTLFVDASHSVRVGPAGENALTRLVKISAALGQAIAGQRDLTGLCLFDQDRVRSYIRPARHKRHVIQMLNQLSEAASLLPTTKEADAEQMLSLGYGFAEEVYPDLVSQEINSFPWWLSFVAPPLHFGKSWFSQLFKLIVILAALAAFFWMFLTVAAARTLGELVGGIVYIGFLLVLGVVLLRVLWGMLRGLGTLITARGRRYRRRKKLSALLSVRYDLAPQGLGEMLENDGLFVEHLQRFLSDHQVPFAVPYYDKKGKYLHAAPAKVDVLARALLGAVARGKDNELYVLLVDLLETEPIDSLIRAVKVAVARHHQVIVLCPWPPGIPLPPRDAAPVRRARPFDPARLATRAGLLEFLERQTTARLHRAYYRVRRAFGRLGVTVHCAAEDDSIELILERMQRLRSQLQGVR